MDRADLRQYWAESLDTLVWQWPPEQLKRLEPVLPPLLATLDVGLPEVLGEISDESLALSVQKDFLLKPAFEELFVNRYTVYLHRWFFKWRTESHRVLDLTQQIFLKFLEKRLGSYKPTESFRGYLRQTAYYLWVEKVHRPRRPCGLESIPEPLASGATPESGALGREMEERIESALQRLPEEQQRVLRDTMSDKSADEIAQHMGIPKQRVFMLLFRARRRMEQELGIEGRKPRGSANRR
jgi:RNA polymerase sigma factor (sigma-70 family)